jgi:hypothetical protein
MVHSSPFQRLTEPSLHGSEYQPGGGVPAVEGGDFTASGDSIDPAAGPLSLGS